MGRHTAARKVRRVEPSGFMKVSALGVEEQRVNVIIDFVTRRTPAPAGRRLPRRGADRALEGDDVLKVPVGALFRQGEGWAVFVVEDGRVRRQTVQLGQRNENEGQITRGLEAGRHDRAAPAGYADGRRAGECSKEVDFRGSKNRPGLGRD